MQYRFLSHYFIVTLLAVSCAAGLVWLDSFRDYQAVTTILVIDKSESGEAAENLIELSHNLSFYEEVIAQDDLLDDTLVGLTPDQRRAGWQKMLDIEHQDGSGLIQITTWGDTRERARLLGQHSVIVLFNTGARYYNVKTELDLRIVDGPYITPAIRSYFLYIATSLFTGLIVTSLFFLSLSIIETWMRRRTVAREKRSIISPENTESMFIPSVPIQWEHSGWAESPPREELPSESAPLTPSRMPSGTAPAPPNLPVLMDKEEYGSPLQGAMARLIKADIDETVRERMSEPEPTEIVTSPRTEEPTQEEYKRRLNALLSGKMK